MNRREQYKYERRTEVIKALAHRERLHIVDILAKEKTLCVCELQDKMGINISTLSRHLDRLKKAGIVDDRREGRNIHYSLKMCCVDQFFGCVDNILETGGSCTCDSDKKKSGETNA